MGAFAWDLELLELEAGAAYQQAYRHSLAEQTPKVRRRAALPHEAHVDFDRIEADADRAAALLGKSALASREAALETLIDGLRALHDAPAVVERLTRTAVAGLASIPGMLDVVDTARQQAAPVVAGLAARQAEQVRREAALQGITTPGPPQFDAPGVAAALEAALGKVATTPPAQVLDVARITAAQLAGVQASIGRVLDGVVAAVDGLSVKGPLATGKQVANAATGIGRHAGAQGVSAGGGLAVMAYASELLDERTCEECEIVDGTEYQTESAALADYPGGQYVLCEGGAFCRGMLIYIWQSETPATIGI